MVHFRLTTRYFGQLGVPRYRPDALRVRGELRAEQTPRSELAETDFRDAIPFARKMAAKAWELRATMSLARLIAKQDRTDEARAILSEVYGWSTEGVDAADLKEAKPRRCSMS